MFIFRWIKKFFSEFLWYTVIFFLSITLFLCARLFERMFFWLPIRQRKKVRDLTGSIYAFIVRINRHNRNTISRLGLIELAFGNMMSNKSRSFITVGGMAVGIGAIVFLVSIGYGAQDLVLARIAGLEEIKQANVSPQTGSKIRLDDAAIEAFRSLPNVSAALPLLSVVGNVNYQASKSDMAVYGVTSEYLEKSAIRPIKGKIFDNNETNVSKDVSQKTEVQVLEDMVTNGAPTSASDEGDWVDLEDSSQKKENSIQRRAIVGSEKKEAVLSRSAISLLGLDEENALGTEFTLSLIVPGDLLENPNERVSSFPEKYMIVGITPDEGVPQLYIPFVDVRSLGISSYSQVKVVSDMPGDLDTIRKQINSMGFVSQSVADTVSQVNALFSTARVVLALLGMVALAVASLGMFNTLTVSLLERTREVGLMKAMGMQSTEVKELFLTESMVISFVGGFFGILLGYLSGKVFGLILSVFSLVQGEGVMNISVIPVMFVFFIVFLSLFVGIVTGIYPAKRSARISALNALRYE